MIITKQIFLLKIDKITYLSIEQHVNDPATPSWKITIQIRLFKNK